MSILDIWPFNKRPEILDRLQWLVQGEGIDDPVSPLNNQCFVYKRDFQWCAEGLTENQKHVECREELHDMLECHRRIDWHHKIKILEMKRAEKVREGWVPPHGSRQFLVHKDSTRIWKDRAPLGQRWEHLDKEKYLKELAAGDKPHMKYN